MDSPGDTPFDLLAACGRLLAGSSPRGLALVIEASHTVRYVNPAFCRLVGRPPDVLLGRPVAEAFPCACAETVVALLDRVAARGGSESARDFACGCAGEAPAYRSATAWPFGSGTEPAGLVLQMADATEAVGARALAAETAAEIREANEQLLIAGIREREAARQAQEAVRSRDVFLARASHELRTPLTSALGTVRLLRRALDGDLRESPDFLLGIALRNLNAMTVLIENLLDASRLSQAGEVLVLEPVVLADLVRHALDLVTVQARERGIRVAVDLPARLAVCADPLKLEQVLVNLLANAVKFTPMGGEVSVSGAPDPASPGSVRVTVRDSGEGLAPEHLDRVFEPFYQVTGISGRRPRGAGLGLAICRQIVSLHGGAIWAESEGPGCGCTFIVRLPAAAASDEPAARAELSEK